MKYIIALVALFFARNAHSQISLVDTPHCTYYTLHAAVSGGIIPTSSGITADDGWSGVVPIGFSFTFYGTANTQCVIGSNGCLGFNLGSAGGYNTWPISSSLATTTATDINNVICGPWCDVYIPAGGTIDYSMQGTAPFRNFAVTWCGTAMYSCTSEWLTTQIIIYETTGLVEVHIQHRTACLTGWNGQHAICGVRSAGGTSSTVAPGPPVHDYPVVWTVPVPEAWRFTPAPGPSYTVSSIPYAPIPYAASGIYWYDSATHAYLGTGTTVTVDPLVPTTYEAAALGCNDTTAAFIRLLPPNCFRATADTPCAGDTIHIWAVGDSTGATYAWSGPGGYTSTMQHAFVYPSSIASDGLYQVNQYIGTALAHHDSIWVHVRPLPVVTAGSNSPLCSGPPGILLLTATPDSVGETFSWTGPNGFTSALQNPSISGPPVSDGGLYKVVTVLNGCTDSGFVTVTIDTTPALPTASNNSPLCSPRDPAHGNTLLLTASDVTPGVTYVWTGPGGFLSFLQNPSYPNVPTPASGTYTVTVSILADGLTCLNSNTTLVVVDSTPYLPVAGSNAPVCTGHALLLSATSDVGSGYSWTGPNSFTSGLQNPSITATMAAAGTYSVSAGIVYPGIPGGCISDTATITVVIDSTPQTPTASSNSPGPPSLCERDTLLLTANDGTAGVVYNWAGPNSFTSTLENPTIPNVTAAATGQYTVTVTLNGTCPVLTVITVTITPTPILTATNNGPVCSGAGDTLFLQASSNPGATFSWTGPHVFLSALQTPYRTPVEMDMAGVYQVTAKLGKCVSLPENDTVVIHQTPPVVWVKDTFYCQHWDAPPLQAFGDSVLWYASNNVHGPASLKAPAFSTSTDTVMWFYVTQTVMNCTSAMDSFSVTINPKPVLKVTPSVDICPHDSVVLIATDLDPKITYHWSPAMYLEDTNKAKVVSRPLTNITYEVVTTNQYACHDTAYTSITVNSNAFMYLGDSVTLYPGETYQLEPQTNCTSFTWFPAAGLNNPYLSNPVASPQISTKYIVRGQTSWGCVAVDSINIYVNPETLLTLPNAFSPGAGPNNEFKIIKRGLATLNYFRIFDRWGTLVFETNNMDQGWDGTYKGAPQPFGVYVYQVSAVTSTGQNFEKHGNTTLLR